MRRRMYWLLLLLMVVALAACQGTPEATPTQIPVEPTEAPAEATAVPEDPEEAAEPTAEPVDEPESFQYDAEPLPAVDDELAAMAGLEFDDFLYESYRALMMRNPELVLEYGLSEQFGYTEPVLTNVSEVFQEDTEQLERGVLEQLQAYDRESLSADQQISYDVYELYLQSLVEAHQYHYLDFPATFFILGSHTIQTQLFLQDNHPMETEEDALAYIYRLWAIEQKFDQIMETMKIQEEMGIYPSRLIVRWTASDLKNQVRTQAVFTPYYTIFEEKLSQIEDISAERKEQILAAAEEAIDQSVLPAYNEMIEYVNSLLEFAPDNGGLWQYEGGEEYYQFLLEKFTTTDMTADEIHQLGLEELERIHAEMRATFTELGYPEDASLEALYKMAAEDGGSTNGPDMEDFYTSIIREAEATVVDYFDMLPEAQVVVVGGDMGAYYTPGTLDGSRPGTFYANTTNGTWNYNAYSVAYHEAVPGHHLQIALMQEMDLPLFRNILFFDGYGEGWALYAENLADEMGLYDEYLYGRLGMLSYQALRACRMVADTGIHTQGWTYDEAVDFLVKNAFIDGGYAEYEAARYTVYPAQATAYLVGYLDIMDLRQQVMDALGDDFNIKQFHNAVLQNGAVPLEMLDSLVLEYFGLLE